MKLIEDYAIGDEIFRHVEGGGTFRYLVLGVRAYEDEVQLEAECQSCTHGFKCRVLLARNDLGKIVAVHMLNEDEEDPQRHWHTNDGLHFWPTRSEAREEGLRLVLKRVDERIKEAQGRLDNDKAYRARLAAAIEEGA